jgi:DNA-binding Xre family transcriptional regulator
MPALQHYLRGEIDRRAWSINDFARRAHISQSNAYLIVRDGKDDVRQSTFDGIAAALGMAPSELLRAVESPADDPVEQAIRWRAPEMRAAVKSVPAPKQATLIMSVFDRAIDAARDMAALLTEQQSQPRTAKNRVDTRATGNRPGRSTGANRGGGKLRLPERVAAFALAGA